MPAREPRAVAHRSLWIDVDEQGLHSPPRERGGEIYSSGGFADSSLLAYDSENRPHLLLSPRILAGLQLRIRGRRLGTLHLVESFLGVFHPAFRFRATW